MNKPQKILLTIGISLGIIIIYVAFFIYPQATDILELNNKINKEKTRQQELRIKEQDIKQAKEKEKEIAFILNKLSVHLTASDDILNFIIQLEDIAKNTNNTQEINILEETTSPKAKKTENVESPENTNAVSVSDQNKQKDYIEVEVKLQGSFESLINYLSELKKASILTDEQSLDSQLSELTSLPENQPLAENTEAPKTSDITTTLLLKVFIKNNAAKQP